MVSLLVMFASLLGPRYIASPLGTRDCHLKIFFTHLMISIFFLVCKVCLKASCLIGETMS